MAKIAKSQTFMTVLKITPLLFVISLLFFSPTVENAEALQALDKSRGIPQPEGFFESISLIWKTIPYAIFGYWGFEACSNISHRISGSKKNASRVIWMSFLLVCTLYTLFHLEVVRVMGSAGLFDKKVEGFISYAGWTSQPVLDIGFAVFALCLSISYFNAVFSELLSYSFVVQTLAKDKTLLLSDKLKRLNKNSQPVSAIFLNCTLTFFVTTFILDKAELVAIANMGLITTFCFCLLALLKLSLSKRDFPYVFIALLGFVSCFFVGSFSLSLVGNLDNLLPLLGLALFGVVIYFISRRFYSSGRA